MTLEREHGPLSTDLDDPSAVPYFLWDEPMTVAELRARLGTASPPERTRLLGKILREARDTDVWRFTSPAEVSRLWPEQIANELKLGSLGIERAQNYNGLGQRRPLRFFHVNR